ncbi:MAG: hypothetical protein ACRENP_16505 [Longimicrobiales bacterium]
MKTVLIVFVFASTLLAAHVVAQRNAQSDTAFLAQVEIPSQGVLLRGTIHVAAGKAAAIMKEAEQYDVRKAAATLAGRTVFLIGAQQDQTAPLATHFQPLLQALQSAQVKALRDTIVDDTHNMRTSGPVVFAAIARWLRQDCWP